MAPLEPQEKVLVSEEFLSSTHGDIACDDCHGGNPAEKDKEKAHAGLDPYPAANNPDKTCGECHDEIVKTAKNSLHATLSSFKTVLKSRADMALWVATSAGPSLQRKGLSMVIFSRNGVIRSTNVQPAMEVG